MQLYGRFQDVEIVRLSHQSLLGGETRAPIVDQVASYLAGCRFDLILVDNPLSVLALDRRIETPIVFDCIDWYAEMYAAEFDDPAGLALIRSCFEECVRRGSAIVAQSPLMLAVVWASTAGRWWCPTADEALFRVYPPMRLRRALHRARARRRRRTPRHRYTGRFANGIAALST
jgi:hypothetical protein